MNVVDILILIALALGAVLGFKEGVIKKTTGFVGTIVIIVLSFYLKNYLSVLLYKCLPFFNFTSTIKGLDALNILLYEIVAFLIIFVVLKLILMIILTITGLIESILKATVILSIPSKLLGIVVGIIEMYLYVFIALVIITLPVIRFPYVKESKIANFMLNETPLLSSISEQIVDTYDGVYKIIDEKDNKTNEEVNEDIIKLLLRKEIVTKEVVKDLVDKNKVHINDYSILD